MSIVVISSLMLNMFYIYFVYVFIYIIGLFLEYKNKSV